MSYLFEVRKLGEKKEKDGSILQSLTVYACFVGE